MKNRVYRSLLMGSAVFGLALFGISPAQAEESLPELSIVSAPTLNGQQPEDIDQDPASTLQQLTSVSELKDVQPTDWAYEALKSLVERYGCIVGYPDQTFRGNRALSRWEFAAGLNACLNTLESLLQENLAVLREDIDKLNRLAKEFEAELAALGARVDNLEKRPAYLEDHQFSTTVKLTGEVILSLTSAFQGSTQGRVPVFQDRVRLFLESSVTGKDLLSVQLEAGNSTRFQFPGFPANAEGNQTFNLPQGNNEVSVAWVAYEFPINDSLYAYIPAYSGRWWDFVPVLNPVLGGHANGKKSLSIFGRFNPIYAIGGGSGIGLNYKITDKLTLSGGYFAGDDIASNPSSGNGLFNGQYSALGQLTWSPSEDFGIGFTYVNAYKPDGFIFNFGVGGPKIGNAGANAPFGNVQEGIKSQPSTNSYGASTFYRFSPGFVVNGFFGYTNAQNTEGSGSGDIWYYALGLGFPDLGKEGNLGGIVIGAEPYLGEANPNDLSLHLEAFYKYQINNNISITPGIIWITSPNQNSGNADGIIGTIRTTFSF